MSIRKTALLAAGLIATAAVPASASDTAVPFPDGYREWRHVKSMVIEEGHALYAAFGGIHHLYANPKALEGYRSGRFPDGAVIAFDLLEAPRADGAVTEGARKVLGVMHKDSKKYAATGGWGFEGFAEGDRARPVVGADAKKACFECHQSQKERDYVFSGTRD
jgi:hypothetical protein